MPYIGQQPTSVAFLTDTFSGNGSTTAFTLSAAPAGTSSILVAISGVVQDPSTYSVVGTTLTFSPAPPPGTGNISVRFLGIPASGVTTTAYRTVTEFTATAGQTTFSVPSYTPGFIDVYRNGVMLGSADYTASNGVSVVLASGATAGDLVEVISMSVSSVLNAIPAVPASVNTTNLVDGSVTAAKLASGSALSNIGAGNITPAFLNTQAQYTGFKNRIINGDMNVAQRGAVNVTAGGSNTYLANDRFTLTNYWGSGQVNTAQSTTAPSGFTNSLSLTVATSAPLNGSTGYACALWQSIEGFNIADCYNTSVTLSFWVRSSVTGTYSITFANNSSSSVGDGSRIYVANYTISVANTWEQKTITVNLASGFASGTWNTTNGAGLCVVWNLGAESNRKGNQALESWQTLPISGGYPIQSASQVNWLSNSGATFFLTGVQVEKGTVATSYDYLDYGRELALCQRYYWTTTKGTYNAVGSGIYQAASAIIVYIKHPVAMRAVPTFSYNGTIYAHGTTTSYLVSSIASTYAGIDSSRLDLNLSSSGVAGWGTTLFTNNGANDFVQASAEL